MVNAVFPSLHSISIMFDGSLEILNATRNDEGVYTCLAENDRGKANSTGTLTITGITLHPALHSCLKCALILIYLECSCVIGDVGDSQPSVVSLFDPILILY